MKNNKGKYIIWSILVFVILFSVFSMIYININFSKIQNPELEFNVKKTSIQWVETIKLFLLFLTPILTALLFINTINVQKVNAKNLSKDSLSKDFYNLLGLFKQEQKKSIEDIRALHSKINQEKKDVLKLKKKKEDSQEMIKKIETDYDIIRSSVPNSEKVEQDINTKEYNYNIESADEYFDSVKNSTIIHFNKISTYLKLFHRIIKVLNYQSENRVINKEETSMYLGILRAQLSSEELYVLLINSLEYERGTGLGVELMGNSFFGDEIDLNMDQHFYCPAEYKDVLNNVFVSDENGNEYRNEFRDSFQKYRKDKKNIIFMDLYKELYPKETNVR